MDLSSKLQERKSQFKKTIDNDDTRRRRVDVADQLRKQQREESIAKRRTPMGDAAAVETGADDAPASHAEVTPEKLQSLVNAVNSNDPAAQLDAVTNFRKLLSIERNPPIREVINCGVVPKLVTFLTASAVPTLQFEAAWALTNIASGSSNDTAYVVELGAIPIFVQLLRSGNPDVAEQAVWALGNIAGDSAVFRDQVLRHGALAPLLQLCTPAAKLSLLRNATWTLSNLCRGKPQPPFEAVAPALPTLAGLLNCRDDEVLTDACWALSYLSDDTGPNNQKIQAVIQTGVARRLVELLMHRSPNVKTPALRTVGNIVTGDDLQTQVILQNAALPCLLALLNHTKKGIRKEACWTISNITAGNHEQIQAVIDANIIPPLIAILRTAEFEIKKEAAWAISNATSGGTPEQIRYLVAQAVISPLCALFSAPDPKVVMVALEGIENILRVGARDAANGDQINKYAEHVEACKGLDAIEALQRHNNEEIYNKASRILQEYFDSVEDTADDTAAAAAGTQQNAFQFAPPGAGGPGNIHFG